VAEPRSSCESHGLWQLARTSTGGLGLPDGKVGQAGDRRDAEVWDRRFIAPPHTKIQTGKCPPSAAAPRLMAAHYAHATFRRDSAKPGADHLRSPSLRLPFHNIGEYKGWDQRSPSGKTMSKHFELDRGGFGRPYHRLPGRTGKGADCRGLTPNR